MHPSLGKLRWLLAAAALIAIGTAVRQRKPPGESLPQPPGMTSPAQPAGGRWIRPGESIQRAIVNAAPGQVFYLSPGVYPGPLIIRTRLTLWGSRAAVIQSDGSGTTVRVLAGGTRLLGFTVDGSGPRYDRMDAAVYVRGDNVHVEGLRMVHSLFGLVAEQSRGIVVRGNRIEGNRALAVGIRGDGIRFWGTSDSLISRNFLEDSRDIVIWYSPGNRIVGNYVTGGRYATHFMFSSDSIVEGNSYLDNIVGVFIMYSHDIRVINNTIAGNMGDDGMGLGGKESGNILLRGNRFVRDRVGLYLDTCPYRKGDRVRVERNLLAMCNVAITFHKSETRNLFAGNTLRDNLIQVRVESRGDALGVDWRHNYFDDYRGYDMNGDGYGDVPYELRSLSGALISEHPSLAFFSGTAALLLIDAAAEALPLFQPKTLLIDRHPRIDPGTRS